MANEFIARRGFIALNGATVSGSLFVTSAVSASVVSGGLFFGNGANITGVVSSSFAATASAATSITFTPASASYALVAQSVVGGTANATSASFAQTALTANTASSAQNAPWSGLNGVPVGLVSASGQITYTGLSGVPVGIVSSSGQINYTGLSNTPVGILSGSAQINLLTGVSASFASRSLSASFAGTDWSAIANVPIGIVSSSTQTLTHINNQNVTLGTVTASNLFVDGTVTAKSFNSQHVSSSIIYQSGSTKFGDTADDVMSVTGSFQVSGGVNIAGPAIFQNGITAPTLNGVYESSSALVVNIGTTVVATVSTGSLDSAFFSYVTKNGLNYRAGTVMSVWSASVVEHTEFSTADIGNTSDISFSVDVVGSVARLKATVGATNGWMVKTIISAV